MLVFDLKSCPAQSYVSAIERGEKEPGAVILLTSRGVRVEFTKEGRSFSGEDSALSKLLLSVMGAFAEFERSLILERQREGIVIAKAAGKYKGRKLTLTIGLITELQSRATLGESKSQLAREFGISRETVYQYLRSHRKQTRTRIDFTS